jgi:hypothetical protein
MYQQVISILTIPPGNLVYHLVLAFSIAGALPGALNLWQRDGLDAGRRMVIGLGLLLLAQFLLIFNAGLAQFFPISSDWMPILDRAVTAISLVILIWLWVFPQASSRIDSAALLTGLLILLLTVLTGLWWGNQPAQAYFNGSPPDLLWAGLSLLLGIAGGILLLIRRPAGYGIGLGMFTLLSLGLLVYLIDPSPVGDYPGVVRIMQIAAYPLLLTLPIRFSLGDEPEELEADRRVFQNLQTIAASSDSLEVNQSITAVVSHAMNADLCLLLSPPDANKHINLLCGYDLVHQRPIGAATFEGKLIPVVSESLRQGRPLHLPAEGSIPDLEGFEKILGRPISGSLLSAPMLMPNGESDRSLLLLTPESDRSWTAADQNHLADIAGSLAGIIDLKNLSQSNAEQLAQTSSTLQNIQDENDRLNDELIEMSSRYNSSEQKVEQLQIELRKLMDDLEMDPTSQTQDKGLPE